MKATASFCAALSAISLEILAGECQIVAGKGWIPSSLTRDVSPGSALDFSGLVPRDAPAGRHGFVRVVDGHFEFEGLPGVRQRFFGANLCMEACYPRTEAEADLLVERLVRLGYNSIRLHHHDGYWQGDHVDRLDRFLAKAIAAGLYVTTDLYVSRKVPWRDLGIDKDGYSSYKNMLFVNDAALKDWKNFARKFLLHRNPYTGRTYAEEPAIACISLVNENSIMQNIGSSAKDPFLTEAWRKWLLERRAEDPGCWPSLSPDKIPTEGGGWSIDPVLKGEAWDAVSRFCAELERGMYVRMRDFLRGELGVRVPLTDQNYGTQSAPMQEVRAELYDYADTHFYVDHPVFPEEFWKLPSTLKNENRLEKNGFGFEISWRRTFGQPFTVSEWNFCGPGSHRSMAGLYMGALAALQDWDALWRFDYACWYNAYDDKPRPLSYFEVADDPSALLSERLTAALFLRGDLPPLDNAVATVLTEESVRPPERDHSFNVLPRWWQRQLDFQVGTVLPGRVPAGVVAVPMDAAAREGAEPPVKGGGSPAVSRDPARGTMSVSTPLTCALYASGEGKFSSGPLAVENSGGAATVWATSLDGRPLASSSRMLFVRLGDVQGNGSRFSSDSRRKILAWGSTPCAESGKAEVSLAIGSGGQSASFEVFALAPSGAQVAQIPCCHADGVLRFTADTARDPTEATLAYEIVRKDEASQP